MNDTETEILALSMEIIHRLTSHVSFVVNELVEDYQKSSLIQLTLLRDKIKKMDKW